jgi:hypothetical protein
MNERIEFSFLYTTMSEMSKYLVINPDVDEFCYKMI